MAMASSLLVPPVSSTRMQSGRGVTMRICAMAEESSIEQAPGKLTSVPPPPKTKDPLLTMQNFKKVYNRKGTITDVDHYARLQVPWQAPPSQIAAAFKERVEQLMSQTDMDEEAVRSQLQELQESFDILTSEQQRRLYDWSLLQQKEKRYVWPYEADITQKFDVPDPPQDEEDMEAIYRVGYFFLAWFILSLILGYSLHD